MKTVSGFQSQVASDSKIAALDRTVEGLEASVQEISLPACNIIRNESGERHNHLKIARVNGNHALQDTQAAATVV
jgi:hypothetical protein